MRALDILLDAIEQGSLKGRVVDPEGAKVGNVVIKLVRVNEHRSKLVMEKQ